MLAPSRQTSAVPDLFPDAANARAACLLRMTLAFSGLLVAGLGQKHIGPHAQFAWLVLMLYSIYSVGVYVFALYRDDLAPFRLWHWIDVGWCAVLVGLSGGSSVFAVLFIFPIVVSSFRCGFSEGMYVSAASAALWLAAGLAYAAFAGWDGWDWILLRAALFLAVAYMIARWAGLERLSKARLELLREINRVPNPRFGPDRVIGVTLERLRDFYKADTCLAVISAEGESPRILLAEDGRFGSALVGSSASALAEKLLSLPDECAVACKTHTRWPLLGGSRLHVDGVEDRDHIEAVSERSRDLTLYLDAGSWASVPLELRRAMVGRVYLMSRVARFNASDILLLRQAVEQLMPMVETVQFLDSLASEAADKERRKISLDLHDSTIQPYLGLKLGLESLCRKVEPANPLAADLNDLCRITNDSIAELRSYVRDLKTRPRERSASLLEGVQRQVDRFSEFYEIEVELNASPGLSLNDRLTAEVLQMIGESLSNIGRHTDSRRVTINLSRRGERFLAQIINHGGEDVAHWQHFRPDSINQRATQLGGSAEVSRQPDGGTAVTVDIPL